MKRGRTLFCACVFVCVKEGTDGGVGGSVSQVHAGAKQSHQLLFIVGDVPLHDLLTGTQEALKRLNVYYCKDRRDVRFILFLQVLKCSINESIK